MTSDGTALRASGREAPWPDEVRYLTAACAALGLSVRDLSGDGYLLELSDGSTRLALAAGRACLYPTNTASAFTLTKDKMHTTRLLDAHGIPTLGGALFFVSERHRRFRAAGREREDAVAHARAQGFPRFGKPNTGSRGDLAEILPDVDRLRAWMHEAAARYDDVIVQDVFAGPEYRVLCVGDEALYAAERAAVELTGDGERTLESLLDDYNRTLIGSGISGVPRGVFGWIAAHAGVSLGDVLAPGVRVVVPGRRNVAAAGTPTRVMVPAPTGLATRALAAARVCGLHVAGVDLMDVSAARDGSDLRVVEVNGGPSITALEAHGHSALILDLWRRVLSRAFGRELSVRP